MKLKLITLLFGVVALYPSFQIKAQNIEKLNVKGYHASFAGNNTILFSKSNYTGLYLYDLNNESLVTLSDEQKSGKDVYCDNDQVYFSINQGVIKSDFNGNKNEIIREKGELNTKEAAVEYLNNPRVKRTLGVLFVKPVNKLKELEIHYNTGDVKIINPINKKGVRYLSSEVSPNGQQVLIKQYGGNAYIINLDGEIIEDLGYMERPKWYGSDKIVYQITSDDGHVISSSDIYKIDVNSKNKVNLTAGFEKLALEPATNALTKQILFHTGEGDLYIIKE